MRMMVADFIAASESFDRDPAENGDTRSRNSVLRAHGDAR